MTFKMGDLERLLHQLSRAADDLVRSTEREISALRNDPLRNDLSEEFVAAASRV